MNHNLTLELIERIKVRTDKFIRTHREYLIFRMMDKDDIQQELLVKAIQKYNKYKTLPKEDLLKLINKSVSFEFKKILIKNFQYRNKFTARSLEEVLNTIDIVDMIKTPTPQLFFDTLKKICTPKELDILYLYYYKSLSFKEIGKKYKVSKQWACVIYVETLIKIKKKMNLLDKNEKISI